MIVAYIMNPVFAVSFMKYKGDEKKKNNHKKIIALSVGMIVLIAIFYAINVRFLGNLLLIAVIGYLFIKYILLYLIDKFQCCTLPAIKNFYRMILGFLLKGKSIWAIPPIFLILSYMQIPTQLPRMVRNTEGVEEFFICATPTFIKSLIATLYYEKDE